MISLRRTQLLTLLSVLLGCGEAARRPSTDDARRAVADFYAWYVPLQKDAPEADMRAIREKPTLFSSSLTAALRTDSIARARTTDEVVGLDGDPFLNSQDPCDQYSPVEAKEREGRFLVSVVGTGGCATHTTPDVTVEVVPTDGRLVFTNFIYSAANRDDLLSVLADLAAARRATKPAK